MEPGQFEPTPLTRVKRLPDRGRYDAETVNAILDAGFVCHVGYVVDGTPVVTPTAYWRVGDEVYFHGSAASRLLRTLQAPAIRCCLTVTHADGLVLARSAFHHSLNYRSVMLFGTAEAVTGDSEKRAALRRFVNRMVPGRWESLRPMTAQELKGTTVLRLRLREVSAKVRSGGPKDEDEDYGLPIWAGVIPLSTVVGPAEPDPALPAGVPIPDHVRAFRLEPRPIAP